MYVHMAAWVYAKLPYRLIAGHIFSRKLTKWSINDKFLKVTSEVKDAILTNKPVVALESAIITHGMPYPHNLKTALEVEETIRSQGAVPATIALIEGNICIGTSKSQLEQLSDPNTVKRKISRRDIALAVSQGADGGTTVAGTMLCAEAAGIHVFVTGGIGGVHRDGETTLDISADLTELGRTSVAVVSSGVKSILDIPRTLEYLETQGVTVATYGPDKEFPAFFTRCSGTEAPYNLIGPKDCAKLIAANSQLSVDSGILIAVPIPEEHSIDNMETVIEQALALARVQGITGKAVTPFLLDQINRFTEGNSLEANKSLVINNATVGAQIAVELAAIHSSRVNDRTLGVRNPSVQFDKPVPNNRPVVVGGAVLDFTAKTDQKIIRKADTNPGSLRTSFGGVGRNIAECLARLGFDPFFITAVGSDRHGDQLLDHMASIDMSTKGVCQLPGSTSTYCAVLDGTGELIHGIGDMSANEEITPSWVKTFQDTLVSAPLVCIDGNVPVSTIQYVVEVCKEANVPVWFEPTCVSKCLKPKVGGVQNKLTYSSPNLAEAMKMSGVGVAESTYLDKVSIVDHVYETTRPLLLDIPHLSITLGGRGLVHINGKKGIATHFPCIPKTTPTNEVISVSGAGDCLVGGIIAGITMNQTMGESVAMGMACAALSVRGMEAVPDTVTLDNVIELSKQWNDYI